MVVLLAPGAARAAELDEISHPRDAAAQPRRTPDPSGVGELLDAPVLPAPAAVATNDTLGTALERLLAAHRAYVDADPARLAEIAHLTGASLVGPGDDELVAALVARGRRTRRTALDHLEQWHAAGLVGASPSRLARAADLLVDGATGIELCFLWDRDQVVRLAAYRELRLALEQQLAGG